MSQANAQSRLMYITKGKMRMVERSEGSRRGYAIQLFLFLLLSYVNEKAASVLKLLFLFPCKESLEYLFKVLRVKYC